MNINVRGQHIALTPSLLEHVERRLRFALARFDGRAPRVAVRVADVNGPRGGADKRCRIAVRMRDAGEIVAEDTGPDLYAAIDAAADRIGRSVQRAVERLRDGVRIPPPAPGTKHPRSRVVPAGAEASGSLGRADGLTTHALQIIEEDAARAGRGARLELTVSRATGREGVEDE